MLLLALGLPLLGALLLASAPSPAHSSQVPVTLRVCRMGVVPCQQDINLAYWQLAALGLYLEANGGSGAGSETYPVAWEYHIQFPGEGLVKPQLDEFEDSPVQEREVPHSLLENAHRLQPGSASARLENGAYYQVENEYRDSNPRQIDHTVTLAGFAADQSPGWLQALTPESPLLLGQFVVRGTRDGTVEVVTADEDALPSRVVLLSGSGEVTLWEVGAGQSLAAINVGSDGERARLEGQVWSQLLGSQEKSLPYLSEFDLTLWESGATPPWAGGDAAPVAAFTGLQAEKDGSFVVKDLPAALIPPGVYDLRVQAPGFLSAVVTNVEVDTSGSPRRELPRVIQVEFGPLATGDLNGDQRVDAADLAAFQSSFGKRARDGDVDSAADLNHDGTVDGQDFSLMAAHLGLAGE